MFRRLSPHVLQAVMEDVSQPTPLEREGRGGMVGVERVDGGASFSREELRTIGRRVFEPVSLAGLTRSVYESAIRKVWVHFVSHDAIQDMLPMHSDRLKECFTELALAVESVASLRCVGSAVAQLHTSNGHPSPTSSGGGLVRLLKPFAVAKTTPAQRITPITTDMFDRLLDLAVDSSDLRTRRAVLIALSGTITAARNQNIVQIKLCDYKKGFDADRDESKRNAAAVGLTSQKQDRVGVGALARIGAGRLVTKLDKWIAELGLTVSEHCEKKVSGANEMQRCRFCPPLFPKFLDGRLGRDGLVEPISRQGIREAVKVAVEAIGVDSARFSGRSMRRGGITTARQAGVPEDVVYLQSGHGQCRPGRRYVHDHSTEDLYAVSTAFGEGI